MAAAMAIGREEEEVGANGGGEASDDESRMTYTELCDFNAKSIDSHHRKVRESEGFDADVVMDEDFHVGPRRFTRYQLNHRMDEMKSCCDLAILTYNADHGTSLKVVGVVKANFEPAGTGEKYYITFTAAEDSSSGAAANYQARLYAPYSFTGKPVRVELCRPEPRH